MSLITSVIAGAAAKVGAELVGKAVGGLFGERGGALAETVVTEVASKLGVPAEKITDATDKQLQGAVAEVEHDMPDLVALWARGLDGQFALLASETKEGPLQSGWRWGWMYLLAVFWIFYVLVVPVLSALGFEVERIDATILLTLTTWFISLYMGGHTVKSLGESAIAAVRASKGK